MSPRQRGPLFAASMLVVVVSLFVVLAYGDTKFVFHVPEGWTDVSPGAPEENFEGLPAETFLDVRSNRFAAIAVDKAHASDGFGESMTAYVASESQAMTERVLTEASQAMAKAKGTTVREQSVVEIGGVDVGRMITDKHVAGRHTTSLVYLLPGDGEHAVLTFTAAAEKFEEYLPVFEASARKTRGITAQPLPPEEVASRTRKRMGWAVMAALGVVIAWLVALRRR